MYMQRQFPSDSIRGIQRRHKHKARTNRVRFVSIILVACFFCAYFISQVFAQTPVVEEEEEYAERTPKDELNHFLDYLSMCESENKPHIRVLDTNDIYSVGMYQFQHPIVYDYFQKVKGEKITYEEFLELAYDPVKSRELARYIIENNFQQGKYNWANCYHKYTARNT